MSERLCALGIEVFGPAVWQGSAREMFWQKHRRQIAFADSAAWCVVGAASTVLGELGDLDSDRIGSILIAPDGPVETRREIIGLVAKGEMSPMRFPAATPSALLAPTLIIHRLRGPSLNFPISPSAAIPIAACVAARWFVNFDLEAVLFATVTSKDSEPFAQALVIRSVGHSPTVGEMTECLSRFSSLRPES
jgi:hypothetical protein